MIPKSPQDGPLSADGTYVKRLSEIDPAQPNPPDVWQSIADDVRAGRLDDARELFALPMTVATDVEVAELAFSIERGTTLMSEGRHEEAVADLDRAFRLAKRSGSAQFKNTATMLASMCKGVALLIQGDAHGAATAFGIAERVADDVALAMPGLTRMALGCKASLAVARARISMNQGDMAQAEREGAEAWALYRRQLSLLDKSRIADVSSIAEVHSAHVELQTWLAVQSLCVLDLPSMQRHLSSVGDSLSELERALGVMPDGPLRDTMLASVSVFRSLEAIRGIADRVVEKRSHLDSEHLELIEFAAQRLFDAKEAAQSAGPRGVALVSTIQLLQHFLESLLRTGKARRDDFGRFNGIVTLAALLVQVVVLGLVTKPTPIIAAVMFLGEMIVAVIAGFGLSAVKLKGLLAIYPEGLKLLKTSK
jgi:hypothetical protein